MSDDRRAFLVRLALSYMLSNLDDVIEAFEGAGGCVKYNGDLRDEPTEAEIDVLMREFVV